VRVAGKHDGLPAGRFPELPGEVGLLLVINEGGFVGGEVHADLGIGQVLEMSDSGHDLYLEDRLDLFCLGGRLDDYEHVAAAFLMPFEGGMGMTRPVER